MSRDKKPRFSSGAWTEAQELLWRYRRRLTLGMVLMLTNRLAGLVLPGSSKYLIDEVIANQRGELLTTLAWAVGGATLIQATTSFALSQVLGVAAQRGITEMRKRVQAHVTRLPIGYFDSTKTGVLISRIMTDAEGIRNLVGTGLVQLIGGLVTAFIALAVLFYLHWQLTSVTLVILLGFASAMAVAFRRLRPLFRERGKMNAEVTGRLNETLGGIRIVKAYTVEKREQRVFAHGVHGLLRNVAKTVTGVSGITAVSTTAIGIIGMLIIVIGGNAILSNTMTLGDLIAYIFFTGLMAAPLVQIASIGTQITEAFAGLDRIQEIRRMATEDEEDEHRRPLPNVRGEVTCEDVSFEYTAGVPVLRNLSFKVPAGTTTALVGSSGSGKSTIISLVMAFNRPQQGRILVDGLDLEAVKLRDYRKHLGVVLQENFLFDGTVADNIRFARMDASLEEIRTVGRLAHCEEFVLNFEKGYETVVGERGIKLSGGQRQRIAIARAILADPRLLILDEATSSLDSESEAMIQDGLRSLRHGRTTLVIAHRLSTIQSADQILVIEDGSIVERGTHRSLLEKSGRYHRLHETQYNLEHDRFINPGEDFTPKLPDVPKVVSKGSSNL